jgi:hypothetical protein
MMEIRATMTTRTKEMRARSRSHTMLENKTPYEKPSEWLAKRFWEFLKVSDTTGSNESMLQRLVRCSNRLTPVCWAKHCKPTVIC